MAPVSVDAAEKQLQITIQTLYTLLVQLHSFRGAETTSALHATLTTLLCNLATLLATTPSLAPISVPREIIAYVEDGRNPDIYTREFVEIVQRQNLFVKAKVDAFAGFRNVLAEEIAGALPRLRGDVERVLEGTGGVGGGMGMGMGMGMGLSMGMEMGMGMGTGMGVKMKVEGDADADADVDVDVNVDVGTGGGGGGGGGAAAAAAAAVGMGQYPG